MDHGHMVLDGRAGLGHARPGLFMQVGALPRLTQGQVDQNRRGHGCGARLVYIGFAGVYAPVAC